MRKARTTKGDPPLPRLSPARRRVPSQTYRAARLHRGLTQEQVARILDVRLATISYRETQDDGVPWETWLALTAALDLPSDWSP